MSRRLGAGLAVVLLLAVGAGWFLVREFGKAPDDDGLDPAAQSARAIGRFSIGVASLDVAADQRAARMFTELSGELPDEPAIWANLGIARMRLGDLPGARQALETAARLAPDLDQVIVLQAMADERIGDFQSAIERLRAIGEPGITVLYQLSQLLSRTGEEADRDEQLVCLDRIHEVHPENLVVAFERARLLAAMGEEERFAEALREFESRRDEWAPEAVEQFELARTGADADDFRRAAMHLAFLQNLSLTSPDYQQSLAALGASETSVGFPLREFVRYPPPDVVVAEADVDLAWVVAVDSSLSSKPDLHVALVLGELPGATLISVADGILRFSNGTEIEVSAGEAPTPGRNSIRAVDLNGDFLQDLAYIDQNGLRIWQQGEEGEFTAILPDDGTAAPWAPEGQGVWAFDFDADGDLDLYVSREAETGQLIRNNGDMTFTAVDSLSAFPELREMLWADWDGDGDGDLALLDAQGRVLISWNDRSGMFTSPEAVGESSAAAMAHGDLLATGEMELVVLEQTGLIRGIHFDAEESSWSSREITRWSGAPDLEEAFARQGAGVFVADLDNNGAVDLVASAGTTSAIWLSQGDLSLTAVADAPAMFITSIADVEGDGALDLVGLTDGDAVVAHARGTRGYHWHTLHTRALELADGRINSFGIGGEISIRAGQLVQSAPILSPQTHFGLGEQPQVDVARIIWPNGVAQAEFELQPDQLVTAMQRLKGSCPWVFARAGDTFHFVKDFIWRSPLGMRINSQDTAGVEQTEDWIKIPGDLLVADDGEYEIRITAELWETHFLDHISLKVVDHPDEFEVYVDERFVPTRQPALEIIAASRPSPFRSASNEAGADVLQKLHAVDADYVDDFPLGRFQGIAEDHWIEFQLPEDLPAEAPLLLIGTGWIYPTDSSLNVAISQGGHAAPRGLMLEAGDDRDGWRAVSGDLGFPAGKNKTIVIPIPEEDLRDGQRRFRLRTNLEIYWDQLGWAVRATDGEARVAPSPTRLADLRYRGFSEVSPLDRRRPDIPRYDRLATTSQRWRDLKGFYTRFGDVRELLDSIDDRYVIMNAGDEFVLRFAAPPPPPEGWSRDFVLVGDGWVKDGDFNTANSETVHPLPFHDMRDYGGPPQRLEEDPMFQQHSDDWLRFHTRYVTPDFFRRGLMQRSDTREESRP